MCVCDLSYDLVIAVAFLELAVIVLVKCCVQHFVDEENICGTSAFFAFFVAELHQLTAQRFLVNRIVVNCAFALYYFFDNLLNNQF